MLIAAGIVLVLALLLASPVTVKVLYENEWAVTVRYLFLRFRVFPPKEKPSGKKEKPHTEKKKDTGKKSQKDEKKQGIREILKGKDPGTVLNLLVEASKLAASVLKRFFSHVTIREFDLLLEIASEDAAETAVQYANACAVGYPAAGVLMQVCRCRRFGISIVPEFQQNKPRACLRFRARIPLFFLLWEAVSAAIRAAKLWQRFQAADKNKKAETTPSGAKS